MPRGTDANTVPFVSRLKNPVFAAMITVVIGGFEGVSYVAYRDPVGIPTICFGETRNVRMGQKAVERLAIRTPLLG